MGITVLSPLSTSGLPEQKQGRGLFFCLPHPDPGGLCRAWLTFPICILSISLKMSGQLGLTQLIQAKMHFAQAGVEVASVLSSTFPPILNPTHPSFCKSPLPFPHQNAQTSEWVVCFLLDVW